MPEIASGFYPVEIQLDPSPGPDTTGTEASYPDMIT
jgi:hypothetical protein